MSIPTPRKIKGNFKGLGGFKKHIFFKEKYNAKLKLLQGLGGSN